MKRRIALFPGSFNPMHKGHLAIVQWLVASGRFDEVRVMLSPHNPLKSKLPAGTVPEMTRDDMKRLQAVRSVLERNCPEVGLEDIEFSLPLPHYTYNTLLELRRREDARYCMVIGSDNLALMSRWYKGMELLAEYEFWVYPREGHDVREIMDDIVSRTEVMSLNIIEAPMVNISSSMIRDAIARGDSSLDEYTDI